MKIEPVGLKPGRIANRIKNHYRNWAHCSVGISCQLVYGIPVGGTAEEFPV
jgi:hypothetical protein